MGKPQKRSAEMQALAVTLYAELGSGNKVAKKMALSAPTVYRMLADAGVHVPDRHSEEVHQKKRSLSEDQYAEIAKRYESGESLKSIRGAFGVGEWAIVAAAKRFGIEVRSVGGPRKPINDQAKAEVIRLFQIGLSQVAIGASVGYSQSVISRILRKSGLQEKPRWGVGERHHAWRGGEIKNSAGYVAEWVAPDDRFACMRAQSGYVLQHRLVMAKALGRPLSRKETVHHINGDRCDNRIENLQLRYGNHGSGIVLKCLCCGSTNIVASEIKE